AWCDVLDTKGRLSIPTYFLPGDEDRPIRLNVPGTNNHLRIRVEISKAPDGRCTFRNAHRIENSDVGHLSIGVAALELNDIEQGGAPDPRREAIPLERTAD